MVIFIIINVARNIVKSQFNRFLLTRGFIVLMKKIENTKYLSKHPMRKFAVCSKIMPGEFSLQKSSKIVRTDFDAGNRHNDFL
jgi:hypothetical protein